MVHIRAPCTVNSVTLWFTVMYDITETEATRYQYTLMLSLDALN